MDTEAHNDMLPTYTVVEKEMGHKGDQRYVCGACIVAAAVGKKASLRLN